MAHKKAAKMAHNHSAKVTTPKPRNSTTL
jgi:hypothetical protein